MTVLQVSDVKSSRDYYRKLGFGDHGIWADDETNEPLFCIVQRGEVTIGLQLLRYNKMPTNSHWAVYIYVSDAKGLHDEFVNADIVIERELEETEYGCIDFDVRDPDGHLISFGQDMNPKSHGPGLGRECGRG